MQNENNAKPLTDMAFSSLDLVPEVQEGLRKAGFTHATPIQALTLPFALQGKDVAGQAQTGTGKTAAFLLTIFQRLLESPREEPGRHPRALVLAPTRELALQIHKDAVLLGGDSSLRFALAYGGVDYEKQRKVLEEGVDVLIGTPGRIIDYFKQKVYNREPRGFQGFAMNMRRPPFDDLRVRQAMAHLVDRQTLVDNIYYGFGYPQYSPVWQNSPYYWDGAPDFAFAYDPEAAKRLLDEIAPLSTAEATMRTPNSIARQRATGTLRIGRAGLEKRIVIRNGAPVARLFAPLL